MLAKLLVSLLVAIIVALLIVAVIPGSMALLIICLAGVANDRKNKTRLGYGKSA